MVPTYSVVESSYLTTSYERTSRRQGIPYSSARSNVHGFNAVTAVEECYKVWRDEDPSAWMGSSLQRTVVGGGGGGVQCSNTC